MSASISTASPMTRLMGKRPQSTSGFTCWMTTLAGGRSVILKAYHGALDGKTLGAGRMLGQGCSPPGTGGAPTCSNSLPQSQTPADRNNALHAEVMILSENIIKK